MPFCNSCGKKVSADNEFCPNCGKKLTTKDLIGAETKPITKEQKPETQPKLERRPFLTKNMMIGALVVFVGALIVLIPLSNKNPCGNGTCDANEYCDSCPVDCGSCELKLADDNFLISSISWGSPSCPRKDYCAAEPLFGETCLSNGCIIGTTKLADGSSHDYNRCNQDFVATLTLKNVQKPKYGGTFNFFPKEGDCYSLIDGQKYYAAGSFYTITDNGAYSIDSTNFRDRPEGATSWNRPLLDITKSHSITICCKGVCKSANLPAYCT